MTSEIIVAVLSLLGTAAGSITGVLAANRLTNYRIEQLEKKVETHNNLVERMVQVEDRAKSNSHRLDDLERRAEA